MRPLSRNSDAIRARQRRAEKASAKKYAKAVVRGDATRPLTDAEINHLDEEPTTPYRNPDTTPPGWVLMPSEDVAQKDAQRERKEKGQRRVAPEGVGATTKKPITFKVKLPNEDLKRTILRDLMGAAFTVRDSEYHCNLCERAPGWESFASLHLENAVEDEIHAYRAAERKIEAVQNALGGEEAPEVAITPPVLGSHAVLFLKEEEVRRKHAAEIRKAARVGRRVRPKLLKTKARQF